MFDSRDATEAGGLMSYSANHAALYRRAAGYVDKLLRGARPADLAIEQLSQFELVINLKTAKALGLTIPPSVLQTAESAHQIVSDPPGTARSCWQGGRP